VAIGVTKDGHIIAGCFFENYNEASLTAHLAIKGRITREFLWCLADYAFRQHKIHKLIAPIVSTNADMRSLAFKMGFVHEATIRDAAPNGDIDIFTMTKAQCRFLGERYNGQAKTA
jgi:RimJ/RimL family protein N-acetyltransferase